MRTALALIIATTGIIAIAGCQTPAATSKDITPVTAAPADTLVSLSGTVAETLDTADYTYLNITSHDKSRWAAIPKTSVTIGDQVTLLPGLEVYNVDSKALGRRFDTVVFSQGLDRPDQVSRIQSEMQGKMAIGQGDITLVQISGRVVETMTGGGYTYVAVEKDGNRTWVAISTGAVKVGQDVTFAPGMVMPNFKSKALNRTFDSIVFSDGVVPTSQQTAVAPAATLRTVFHGTQEFALEDISGKVVETVTASGYTYVAVEKDNQRIWIATPQSKVAVGDQVAFQPGEVKRNYHSKKLNRTFPLLVFSRNLVNK